MRWIWKLALSLFFLTGIVSSAYPCGHEGAYFGLSYNQLFLFSFDKPLTAGSGKGLRKIEWGSRFGGLAKFGYDFCKTRFGIEVPLGWARQKLNREEDVDLISGDANLIFHILETEEGADFYWIGGLGASFVTEGTVKDRSRALGMNFNFGPGFQYFFARGMHRAAVHFAVPAKFILFFGNNLSKDTTSVIGIPLQVGFTMSF